MSSVNHLETGREPPQEDNWVYVTRDATGGYYVESSEPGWSRGAPLDEYPVREAERDAAIERAMAHADRRGVKTVYVIA